MTIEAIISLLSLTSILTGFPAIIMLALTGLIVLKTPPSQARKFIIEQTPPPPKPEKPKRRVITCTVPEDIQKELDRLLKRMEGGPVPEWTGSTENAEEGGGK